MKDKALKIIAAVLAVTTVASAAAFFLTKGGDGVSIGKPSKEAVVYSYENSDYTKTVSVKGTNGEVYLPTDVENVYFTADLKGNVLTLALGYAHPCVYELPAGITVVIGETPDRNPLVTVSGASKHMEIGRASCRERV